MPGDGPGPYAALYYNTAITVMQINVGAKGEERSMFTHTSY